MTAKLQLTDNIWAIPFRGEHETGERWGFARAYVFDEKLDLTSLAKSLPEGTVLCDPYLIAGLEHIRNVLFQAIEYWSRGQSLARNKSIDLLMRITCQSQIASAVGLSNISKTNRVAVFGVAGSREELGKSFGELEKIGKGARRDDGLLELDEKKRVCLSRVHSIPASFTGDHLRSLLEERSVLLAFPK